MLQTVVDQANMLSTEKTNNPVYIGQIFKVRGPKMLWRFERTGLGFGEWLNKYVVAT